MFEEELVKLQEELKGKFLELAQKDFEFQSVQELAEAHRMAKDAQAECDHEKEAV